MIKKTTIEVNKINFGGGGGEKEPFPAVPV